MLNTTNTINFKLLNRIYNIRLIVRNYLIIYFLLIVIAINFDIKIEILFCINQ